MHVFECVMRGMTPVSIGAAPGLAAWVLWSGWQVVSGRIEPACRVAEVRAPMQPAHAREPAPLRLVSVQVGGGALPPWPPTSTDCLEQTTPSTLSWRHSA